MSRVRLTNKTAAVDKTPYSGDVGQTRTDPAMDQYDNYEQTVNHELQDLRTEWKQDQRNDIGFGIPTQASIRVTASQAVKLAVLLLGEKAPENIVEAQARDFMRLGSKVLSASLTRFAKTESLYAAEDEEKVEDKKEEVKASVKKADDKTEDKKDEVKADVKVEDKKDEVKASHKCSCGGTGEAVPVAKAEDKKEEVKASAKKADEKVEDKKDEVKAKEETDGKDEMEIEASEDEEVEAATDEDGLEEAPAEMKKANELDIDLGSDPVDEVVTSKEDDEILASLHFSNDEEEVEPEVKKASAKAVKKGLSKIGGQPKVASVSVSAAEADLSSIWNSAPWDEVSAVFE